MIQTNYNPDVLSCLANLSNDEVFTPPSLVNDILDLLPAELWSNPNAKFLDPVSKSGVFLREMAKRLMKGLETQIPDKQERINHIFSKQLYGLAITELTSLLSRRSVYCSKTANGKYSICETFTTEQGNIYYERMQHTWHPSTGSGGKCIYCGASQEVWGRDQTSETYAYNFIHTSVAEPAGANLKKIFSMKFDVIVGNPPYQLTDGGSGTGISAKPLYHEFVKQAIKLNPRYLTMIIPARWFAGGKGLDEFRQEMLNDKRFKILVDFSNSKDCFPGVNIAGGVCYFLWDKEHKGDCLVVNQFGENKFSMTRKLNDYSIFVRNNIAIQIIEKILSKNKLFMSELVSTRNAYGFVSSERGSENEFTNSLKLISSGGVGYVSREEIVKNAETIDKYKVTIGKVVPSNGEVDVTPEMGYRVITTPKVYGPKEIFTESYMLLSSFDTIVEAENFVKFIIAKLPRFLLKQTLTSMNIAKDNFMFVPKMDWSKAYNDEELYEYFDLSKEETEYVDKIMRPIDLSQNGGEDE
jgi:site-specific DNA-methyltransferase (adenine-specific)